ncbi:MAG TPA: outer membrane protein assembly factor BamB [Gammaproteobacteria bacterium]|nr:outer membrane protein assembly factor BamB [Gammaproteobacteria bacterium]
MRKSLWILAAVAAGATLLAGCSGEKVTPPMPLTKISKPIRIKSVWRHHLGSGAGKLDLNLVVAADQGNVYASTANGDVYAFDGKTGKRAWETRTGHHVDAGPGVGGGLVLMGAADGTVLALDEKDGRKRWSIRLGSSVLAVPEASKGVVVVRTVDGHVYGLDASDGSQLWSYSSDEPSLTLRGQSAPLIAGDQVVVGFDNGKLAALSLYDGTAQWERVVAAPNGSSEIARLVDIDADPVRAGDNVYAVAYHGRAVEVALDSGSILWSTSMSATAGMAAGPQNLYVTTADSAVVALDRTTGASVWSQNAMLRRSLTGPAVVGDYVVVGDYQGYVQWLSRKDGAILGRVQVDSDGIEASPVAVGKRVYVYSRGGELACLEKAEQ